MPRSGSSRPRPSDCGRSSSSRPCPAAPRTAPYLQAKGRAIIEDRTAEAQFALDGLRKDLGLILEADLAAGIPTVLVDALLEAFGRAADSGHGSGDISGVAAAFRPERQD